MILLDKFFDVLGLGLYIIDLQLILSFSPCSTVNLVTLSDMAPEIFGKSEILSEEDGEFMMERSVSP